MEHQGLNKVNFAITIHEASKRDQNFGQVSNAFARIVNEETNDELARYDLAEDFLFETAVIIGSLIRNGNEWSFEADGSGYSGELAGLVQRFGLIVG